MEGRNMKRRLGLAVLSLVFGISCAAFDGSLKKVEGADANLAGGGANLYDGF